LKEVEIITKGRCWDSLSRSCERESVVLCTSMARKCWPAAVASQVPTVGAPPSIQIQDELFEIQCVLKKDVVFKQRK
jgi:hypothetical protein